MENLIQDAKQVEQDQQYQTFKENGGSLTEDNFKAVTELLQKMSTTSPVVDDCALKARRAITEQFNGQERVCEKLGITTSQKQKAIYLFLRQYEKNSDGSLITRAGKLTDQEVFADIILMTGTTTDYHTYLNHYPAIAQRRFPKVEK